MGGLGYRDMIPIAQIQIAVDPRKLGNPGTATNCAPGISQNRQSAACAIRSSPCLGDGLRATADKHSPLRSVIRQQAAIMLRLIFRQPRNNHPDGLAAFDFAVELIDPIRHPHEVDVDALAVFTWWYVEGAAAQPGRDLHSQAVAVTARGFAKPGARGLAGPVKKRLYGAYNGFKRLYLGLYTALI